MLHNFKFYQTFLLRPSQKSEIYFSIENVFKIDFNHLNGIVTFRYKKIKKSH
jgi:hypothetical protein